MYIRLSYSVVYGAGGKHRYHRFPSETESGLVVAGYPVRLYARLFGLEAL